ncbi:unnamed protein product [Oikopleura dioica]|uniref:J domain-containing protein n=1 Tax=Oikopleura dioica TaxID=34765 RepID=E4XU93_OIKDI|nr:unnamed protein product [Oikopleura dioica]
MTILRGVGRCSGRILRFASRTGQEGPSGSTEGKDYYTILGVNRQASLSEIKKSYYKLARKYHPDSNQDPLARKVFEQVSEAYKVLRDDLSRAEYDQDAAWEAASHDYAEETKDKYEKIFHEYSPFEKNPHAEWIKGMNFNQTQSDFIPLSAQKVTLKVTFQEAARGGSRRVRVRLRDECDACQGSGADLESANAHVLQCPRCGGTGKEFIRAGPISTKATCHKCHGKGSFATHNCTICYGKGWTVQIKTVTVAIPEGVLDSETVKLMIGDQFIFVTFEVMPDSIFSRDEFDVMQTVKLPLSKLLLGGQIKVHGMQEDTFMRLTVPECTQPETLLRLANHGIKNPLSGEYGDMLIKVKLDIQSNLSARQIAALKQFAEDDEFCGSVFGALRRGEYQPRIEKSETNS